MGFILVLFLALAPRLHAAAPPPNDIQTQIKEPERKQEALIESEKTAKEGRKRQVQDGVAAVTYQEVLAAPDDIELNYRYARTLVRQGNLRGAAATLERILMIDPKLSKVRLFLAVVLVRLDSLDEAQKNLDALKQERMPESLRAEYDEYVNEIRRRRQTTHVAILLGAGLDFDENRNAAPASGRSLITDISIPLGAGATRKNDVAKTMLANISATHELGFQAGHQIYLNGGYYRAEQTTVRILDLQNYSAEAGVIYKTRMFDIVPSFAFSHLLLDQTTYLRSREAKLAFSRQLTPRVDASLESAYARQLYNATQIVPRGFQRTGDKIEGGGGLGFMLTPNMKIEVSVAHLNFGAASSFDAYRRETFTVSHSWLLGKGQYLLTSFIANYDRYQAPEAAISAKARRDDTYRVRLTYGFSLGALSRLLKNAGWTMTYEYYQALSNVTNYAYSNNKVSGLLAFKWDL